jgi:hypothetical protein
MKIKTKPSTKMRDEGIPSKNTTKP